MASISSISTAFNPDLRSFHTGLNQLIPSSHDLRIRIPRFARDSNAKIPRCRVLTYYRHNTAPDDICIEDCKDSSNGVTCKVSCYDQFINTIIDIRLVVTSQVM